MGGLVLTQVDQVLDQHAERRPPVADVVGPQHVLPEEAVEAGERVANDGRAEVTDVHLLGHVGGRVIDDDRPGLGPRRDAEAVVGRDRGQEPAEGLGA